MMANSPKKERRWMSRHRHQKQFISPAPHHPKETPCQAKKKKKNTQKNPRPRNLAAADQNSNLQNIAYIASSLIHNTDRQ